MAYSEYVEKYGGLDCCIAWIANIANGTTKNERLKQSYCHGKHCTRRRFCLGIEMRVNGLPTASDLFSLFSPNRHQSVPLSNFSITNYNVNMSFTVIHTRPDGTRRPIRMSIFDAFRGVPDARPKKARNGLVCSLN